MARPSGVVPDATAGIDGEAPGVPEGLEGTEPPPDPRWHRDRADLRVDTHHQIDPLASVNQLADELVGDQSAEREPAERVRTGRGAAMMLSR